jgi:hypothetical protein
MSHTNSKYTHDDEFISASSSFWGDDINMEIEVAQNIQTLTLSLGKRIHKFELKTPPPSELCVFVQKLVCVV